MRAIFSLSAGRSGAGDRIWEERVVERTLLRRPGFSEYMLSMSQDVAIHSEKGTYLVTAFNPPMERITPFIVRLTKGLLRHHFPQYDYTPSVFEVRYVPLTEELLLEALQGTVLAEIGKGTFFYRYGLSNTQLSGLWYLVFYECVGFLVVHRQPVEDK